MEMSKFDGLETSRSIMDNKEKEYFELHHIQNDIKNNRIDEHWGAQVWIEHVVENLVDQCHSKLEHIQNGCFKEIPRHGKKLRYLENLFHYEK